MNPGDIILNGSLLAAMPLALLAGLISFLSPCVLPLVPGYLGFVSGAAGSGEKKSRSRIIIGATLFVAGFTLVFVTLGAAFGGLGTLIQSGVGEVIQRDALGFAPKGKGALKGGPAGGSVFLGNPFGAGVIHMWIARAGQQGGGVRDAGGIGGP